MKFMYYIHVDTTMFTGTSICMFVLLQHRSKPSWHQNQPSFKLLARPPSRQPGAAARPGTEGLPDPPPSTQATAANMPPTATGWWMPYVHVVQACSDCLGGILGSCLTSFCLILKCCYNLLQRQSHTCTSLPPPYCWFSFPPVQGGGVCGVDRGSRGPWPLSLPADGLPPDPSAPRPQEEEEEEAWHTPARTGRSLGKLWSTLSCEDLLVISATHNSSLETSMKLKFVPFCSF